MGSVTTKFVSSLILTLTALAACSNNDLSSNDAAGLIKKSLFEQKPITVSMRGGDKGTWGWNECNLNAVFNNESLAEILDALEKDGLISSRGQQNSNGFASRTVKICTLTEKGKKDIVWKDKGDNYYDLKLATYVFDEVTGIHKSDKGTSASVKFSYHTEPSIAGKSILQITEKIDRKMHGYYQPKLSSGSKEGTATFALFDDGWRVQSVAIRPGD